MSGRAVRLVVRVLGAVVPAAVMASFIWTVEWYDVFRHGLPGAAQLVIYAAYVVGAGALGYLIAHVVTLPPTEGEAETGAESL